MLRRDFSARRSVVVTMVAGGFAIAFAGVATALAQPAGFAAEITKVELAERRVTFKASMGQQTMRVAPEVALESLKPGDKVLLTFGVDGTESIITGIAVVNS